MDRRIGRSGGKLDVISRPVGDLALGEKTIISNMSDLVGRSMVMFHFHSEILPNSRVMALVVSVSASHTVGREFTSRPGHTKDHHKNGTNCLPAWHAMH